MTRQVKWDLALRHFALTNAKSDPAQAQRGLMQGVLMQPLGIEIRPLAKPGSMSRVYYHGNVYAAGEY